MYVSRDNLIWTSTPIEYNDTRVRKSNVISLRPGATRYVSSRVKSIEDVFLLFFPPNTEKIIIENSKYIEIMVDLLHAYLGILILSGVYR